MASMSESRSRRELFEEQLKDLQRDISNLSHKLAVPSIVTTNRFGKHQFMYNPDEVQEAKNDLSFQSASSLRNPANSAQFLEYQNKIEELSTELKKMLKERNEFEQQLLEARHEIDELKKGIVEYVKLKAAFDHLKQDNDALKVSFESSERIRVQQKELINVLQKSHNIMSESSVASFNSISTISQRPDLDSIVGVAKPPDVNTQTIPDSKWLNLSFQNQNPASNGIATKLELTKTSVPSAIIKDRSTTPTPKSSGKSKPPSKGPTSPLANERMRKSYLTLLNRSSQRTKSTTPSHSEKKKTQLATHSASAKKSQTSNNNNISSSSSGAQNAITQNSINMTQSQSNNNTSSSINQPDPARTSFVQAYLAENEMFRNQFSVNNSYSSLKELLSQQKESYPVQHILQNNSFTGPAPTSQQQAANNQNNTSLNNSLQLNNSDIHHHTSLPGRPPLYPTSHVKTEKSPKSNPLNEREVLHYSNYSLPTDNNITNLTALVQKYQLQSKFNTKKRTGGGKKKRSTSAPPRSPSTLLQSQSQVLYRPVPSPTSTFGKADRFL